LKEEEGWRNGLCETFSQGRIVFNYPLIDRLRPLIWARSLSRRHPSCPLPPPTPRHVRKERKPRPKVSVRPRENFVLMIFCRRSTYTMSFRDTYSN
jgi:hypothetical protein